MIYQKEINELVSISDDLERRSQKVNCFLYELDSKMTGRDAALAWIHTQKREADVDGGSRMVNETWTIASFQDAIAVEPILKQKYDRYRNAQKKFLMSCGTVTGNIKEAYAEGGRFHPTKTNMERQLKAFEKMYINLQEHLRGKFVVIHEEEVYGVFDTLEQAVNTALHKFNNEVFLIRQIDYSDACPVRGPISPNVHDCRSMIYGNKYFQKSKLQGA